MTKKTTSRRVADRHMLELFHALYNQCLAIAPTALEAYELAERVHKKRNGKRFYKNYMSFANSRRHFLDSVKDKGRGGGIKDAIKRQKG